MSDLAACLTAAATHFRANQLDEAEQACQAALALKPATAQALHVLGLIALQRGKGEQALELLAQATEADPKDASIANSQGSILYQLRRYGEAETAFRRAVAAAASLRDPHTNLGNTLLHLNRPAEAASSFRRALALNPRDPIGHNHLGSALRAQGRLEEAADCFRTALALAADFLEARYNLGLLLASQMKYEEALDSFRKVVEAAPDVVVAQLAVGHMLNALGRSGESLAVFDRVLAAAPELAEAGYAARLAYSARVAPELVGAVRNQDWVEAWGRAIGRVAAPGVLALDIGTGSALFAMIAARGGAEVVTSDGNPAVAEVAVGTIAANGLGDRVRVVPKPSLQLRVGPELPHQADVLIADLFGPGLLRPNLLPTLRHALTQLVKPGAKILPAGATVYGQLVSAEPLRRLQPVATVAGFDLSRFDRFRRPEAEDIDLATKPHLPLSEPFVALEFDFRQPVADSGSRVIEVVADADGLCHGIVRWFDLHLDDENTISSGPHGAISQWRQVVDVFPEPVALTAGQRLIITARWDNTRIALDLDR